MNSCLILNSDFKPHDIWSWQDTASALYRDNPTIRPLYDKNGNLYKLNLIIRDGKGNQYDIPSIASLKAYVQQQHTIATYSKVNVYARDKNICQYCGAITTNSNRTIDHVIPRSHWNSKRFSFSLNSFENVVTACKSCNWKKRNRTPFQAKMQLLKKPQKVSFHTIYCNKIELLENIPEEWRLFIHV